MGLLTFQAEGHLYFHEGKPMPGITSIIKEMGLMGDYEPDAWYKDRGTAVHLACEYLDRNCLDWDSLDDEIKPRVEAYQKFKEDYKFVPNLIEQPIHSDYLNVACTLDREGIIDNHDALIEIKNGSRQKWHRLQLSVQDCCLVGSMIMEDFEPRHRYTLELKADGSYKLLRFKEDAYDMEAAKSLVRLYHWLKQGKRS